MIFTRSDFYQHIFEPYNKAVKNGKYVKIEYKLWRTLRDWCCDDQWYNFEIVVDPINGGYNFYLRDDLRITPEVITMARTEKKDFTKYLEDKIGDYWQFDLEFQRKLSEQLTAVSSSKSYVYHDDVQVDHYYDSLTTQYNNYCYETYTLNPTTIKEIIMNEEEKENMKFGNFDFGPVDSSVRLSLYGMAIKNAAGTYVAYDSKIKQIMDVDILNFDGANKFMYKMPAALSDVKTGDIVIHSRRPMFVIEVNKDNRFKVLDIYDGEEKTIVPAKSPFGFDFLTKVVNLFNFGEANGDTPFGNMLPLLMLSDNKNTDDILPLMLMTQGNGGFASNPMLMYALLSKDGKMNDMLPFLLMCGSPVLQTGNTGACACNCHQETGK